MSRLLFSALLAALVHLALIWFPLMHRPELVSASSKGNTIRISMSQKVQKSAPPSPVALPSQPKVVPPKPLPVKEIPAPSKPVKRKKQKKRKQVKKKLPVKRPKAVKPKPPVGHKPAEVKHDPPVSVAASKKSLPEPLTAKQVKGGVQSQKIPSRIYTPEPIYPRAARKRGYEGVVELELLVSGEGKVIEVRLLKSSGRKILDKSAIKGVRRWRYEERRGASAMWVTQFLRFSLLDEEGRF